MTLVFGGAYMGKQDYAKAHLGAGEIEQCGSDLPSFRTGCVAGLERFSRIDRDACVGCMACARACPSGALEACAAQWENCILIVRDISCGVVPIDATERAWREENGRMMRMLARHEKQVIRIWYGLPQVLK